MLLFAARACAAAGSVDSFEGDVQVVGTNGSRSAQQGLEVNEGDTVVTGANAWVLLVMSDGASLTLRPNSRVRLDTYRYSASAPAAENTGVISLMQGAFRSITGLIGQTNRAGYRIVTPSATIGIRGTDHEPAYVAPFVGANDQNRGTYDKVNEGESYIRNPKGEVSVKPGQAAFVHHAALTAPRVLKQVPTFYERHAEIDKRAAQRRETSHRNYRAERQKHQGDPKAEADKKNDAAADRQDLEKARKAREEQQAHTREDRQREAQERRQEKAQQRALKRDHNKRHE